MLSFITCETPNLISAIFGPFLAIFTLFHLKLLQLCKIFPSYIYGTPQVMFGLVNNHGKWCQMSCIIFHDWTFLLGMCGLDMLGLDIENHLWSIWCFSVRLKIRWIQVIQGLDWGLLDVSSVRHVDCISVQCNVLLWTIYYLDILHMSHWPGDPSNCSSTKWRWRYILFSD